MQWSSLSLSIQSSRLLELNSSFSSLITWFKFSLMKTLSLLMCGILLISLNGAQELLPFPENFVVAKNGMDVTLTCRNKTDEAVTWVFDDVFNTSWKMGDFSKEDIQQVGADLTLKRIGAPMLGNYRCLRGTESISSTILLLEPENENLENASISCRAKSYDCNFSCDWKRTGQIAARLGLDNDCSEGGKSCQVASSDKLVKGTFHFVLPHSLSPYTEQSTPLELTLEAIIDSFYFKEKQSIFLREIVQPDSPKIVKCEKVNDHLNVTVDAPPTWSTPHSFFSLEHQIEYKLKDDGTTRISSSNLIPKGISKLRARSRDPLVPSAWSQWSSWKNVIEGGKNLCKCKNTAKYCCPELASENLDNCKKRKKKKRKGGQTS